MFVTFLYHFERNWKYEQELASLLWKIDHKDIRFREQFGFGSIPVTGTMGRVSIDIKDLARELMYNYTPTIIESYPRNPCLWRVYCFHVVYPCVRL